MTLADDIRKDRESGTPDCSAVFPDHGVSAFNVRVIHADHRRRTRVPALEEAYLAALDALEKAEAALDGMNCTAQITHALEDKAISDKWAWVFEDILKEQNDALTAYRTAREKLK